MLVPGHLSLPTMSDALPVHVVWFVRDLRLCDHAPLTEALKADGLVLPLYIVDPARTGAEDYAARYWHFVRPCLQELRHRLQQRGAPLIVRQGPAVEVLADLHERFPRMTVWRHYETETADVRARDARVREWCRAAGVPLHERFHRGAFPGLESRDDWSDRWEERMAQPLIPSPDQIRAVADLPPGPLPTVEDLPLRDEGLDPDQMQAPGEGAAHRCLQDFLHRRAVHYRASISSPARTFDNCSRLSPHLTWGTLSLKTVRHMLRERQQALQAQPAGGDWQRALQAFESRLYWNGHFIQKLDDAPRIQHESYIPAFDDTRAGEVNDAHLQAWRTGQTGYPMVDASIRAFRATGYLNFRMRAMITSFASYDLWLDWRRFAPIMARWMLDYEPGIHYPQVQMQSGTTGINTMRIYNPSQQVRDHDPDGTVIRPWVPELRPLPKGYLAEPWKTPPLVQEEVDWRIGEDYPMPVVEHLPAVRKARERLAAIRKHPAVQAAAARVLKKHGSRR